MFTALFIGDGQFCPDFSSKVKIRHLFSESSSRFVLTGYCSRLYLKKDVVKSVKNYCSQDTT